MRLRDCERLLLDVRPRPTALYFRFELPFVELSHARALRTCRTRLPMCPLFAFVRWLLSRCPFFFFCLKKQPQSFPPLR